MIITIALFIIIAADWHPWSKSVDDEDPTE
jgi:hypothetical protein